jgi:hypothetical protein
VKEFGVSGLHRLSREVPRKPPVNSQRLELNFGLIAVVVLAVLAIVATVMFPDATLPSVEGFSGP